MTTPLFPNVIGWNLLDGGTDAQDGNAYPGPALQEYALTVVSAASPLSNITRNADGTVSGYVQFNNSYAVTYGQFGVTSITGNGTTTTVTYDSIGRITEVAYAQS